MSGLLSCCPMGSKIYGPFLCSCLYFLFWKLQASENDNEGETFFTMHDLLHDYGRWLVRKFTIRYLHYMLVTNCRGELDDRYNDDLRALRCVGCTKVKFNDDSFSRKKSLRVLELKDSYMQKLPDFICNLRDLGYLKISEFTGLVTLPVSFGHLINLFHIDLSCCSGLVTLPESFGKLISLVHVNLSGCSGLVTLPESFGKLISLVHVNLSGCTGLVTLPDSFGKLISLVRVNLSGCSRLVTLPESFGKLISLLHLNLSGCSGVVTLPESFGKLISLVHLYLSGCSGLVTLPESFGKLISLVHVNLSGCSGLVTLPGSFGILIKLFHIDLSGCCRLATLPESFGDLVNLSHVDLSYCHRLREILGVLQKLDKLVFLDLSFWSCFERIDKCLGGLTNLQHLNLSNPCCYLAQHRSHIQKLRHGLCKLTSIRYLNLSMCLNPIFYYHQSQEESLQYIGDCLGGLSSLEYLDLSHNTFLFDLPESLRDLRKLHTLDLSGCIRLKNITEMESLKFIALRNCRGLQRCHFVVQAIDCEAYTTTNIVQLEDVDCGELQISCLENVRSKEETQRIKLAAKQKLTKLKLSWTLDTIRSVEDSALLRELIPPSNLQCLEINGYEGTCLPEYLGDLTSLQELKIICCKQLNLLPDSIEKLTNLKDLFISGCQALEKWCQLEEKKKMLAHIPKKIYEEQASTSRPEIDAVEPA